MRNRHTVLLSLGLVACLSAQAAGQDENRPTVEQALGLRPVQQDVEYETPEADARANCTIRPFERSGGSGWVVVGPGGQVLRRFLDTDNDNVVDLWCYYQSGIEVYRDVDANHNGRVDQSRWMNHAGTRWGEDSNEDGRIDRWRAISAEEASREAVRALASGDMSVLARVLLTTEDLETLGIPQELRAAIAESLRNAPERFGEVTASASGAIGDDTRWVRFDAAMPATVPADRHGTPDDLTVYQHAIAMVRTGSRDGLVQIGEMVRVGDCWKLLDVPRPLTGNNIELTYNGFLLRPETAGPAAAAVAGVDPAIERLLTQLQELDSRAPGPQADARAVSTYHSRRADLLGLLAEAARGEEREQWIRQLADSLGAAVQSGAYAEGMQRLDALAERLARESAPEDLQGYVAYRRIASRYALQIQQDDADFAEIQEQWLRQLRSFIEEYPDSGDAADAMMQLAVAMEFEDPEEAGELYERVADEFPDSVHAARAAGAARRLASEGEVLALGGNGLDGRPVNLAQMRDSVVLVVYWATWVEPHRDDLRPLRALYREYHGDGFEIVGVNFDSDANAAQAFLRREQVNWPQIHDPEGMQGRLATDMGIVSLPTMFLVGPDGRVLDRDVSIGELEEQLGRLLE